MGTRATVLEDNRQVVAYDFERGSREVLFSVDSLNSGHDRP